MENLNNLPPFFVGETVEYITGINMPKGTKVKVSEIIKFPCGCYHINFFGNPKKPKLNSETSNCTNYGHDCKIPVLKFSHWNSNSFRRIKQQNFPLISLSKVIEKQLVSAN